MVQHGYAQLTAEGGNEEKREKERERRRGSGTAAGVRRDLGLAPFSVYTGPVGAAAAACLRRARSSLMPENLCVLSVIAAWLEPTSRVPVVVHTDAGSVAVRRIM